MEPPLPIPRQALADLLRAAGSTMTPEQYLASLTTVGVYRKYASRARAAAVSKSVLLLVALVSAVWTCLPFGFSFEGVILTVGLAVVTFFEYRVHAYFSASNPKAPDLGFRNQASFAAAILIYGLYHASFPAGLSQDAQTMVEQTNFIDPATIRNMTRIFYLGVGGIGGLSQFVLAWYYRSAHVTA